MSNTRYLEINSTYRNRQLYPQPSSFTVLIAQSGTRDRFKALDPVSNAAPLEVWSPAALIVPNGAVVANANNTPIEFVVSFALGTKSKIYNYYEGMPISIAGVSGYRIASWTYTSSSATLDYFTVTINPSLTTAPTVGAVIVFLSSTDFVNGYVWIPNAPIANNYGVGYSIYNQTRNESRTIISFDGTNKIAGIAPAATWVAGDTLVLRNTNPEEVGNVVSGSGNNVVLPVTSNPIANYYTGSFIRITGVTPVFTSRITSYTGSAPLVGVARQLTLSTNLPAALAGGESYEILQFTRDNAVPFTYTGSMVSQQQMVCYEIELINLVLPNKTLTTGGRIAFYPYVYVELQSVSGASSGTKNIIYSNNPHANRMLFRAAIDDIPTPLISPFIKIDGDGMVQTVKFKPNDNFKFGVYLPNGTLLQTITPENFSPAPSNGFNQISALFSMKRL
jgi:hypothetical protein